MLQKVIYKIVDTAKRETSFILVCILLVFFFAGASYTIFLGHSLRYWDEEHYLILMKNLHRGLYSYDGVNSTAFQPPGYPFVLYLFSLVSSRVAFLRFANFVFLSLAIFLLFKMLKKEANASAAVIGAFMAAIYPLFFYTAGTFYPQMFSSLLFLLLFTLILKLENPDWKKELGVGGVLGMLCLTVPSFLLYMPLWLIYPWFVRKKNRGRAVLLLLLGCSLVIGSWSVRNVVVFHRWVFISTNGGINFLLGNSSKTTPESGVNVDLFEPLSMGELMNEFDQDAYYSNEGWKWIKNNPKEAMNLYLLKTLNYFDFKNQLASEKESSWVNDFLSFISYYPLLVLTVIRFICVKKYPLQPFEWYIALFLFFSPFLQAIFFTRLRFRLPFDFLAIYFAASLLGLWMERLAGSNRGSNSTVDQIGRG